MNYFTAAFHPFADFSGRTDKTGYWMFVLFYVLFYIGISLVDAFISEGALVGLYALICLIPSLSIAARRLHDTGRTGWWQLIGLIPLIGWIVLIFLLVQSSEGDNQYGPASQVDVTA